LTEDVEQAEPPKPKLQLGPGRPGFSKRTRLGLLLVLGVAFATALIVGALLASTSSAPKGKLVTIPVADRGASQALLAAAAAVHFQPPSAAGTGKLEDDPLPSPPPASDKGQLAPGTAAPPFSLKTPTGQRVSLASLKGKAVLLELFATWCPHCAAEAPHLKAMSQKLAKSHYAFVAVNADGEDPASILAYHIYFGLPFPALVDPNPSDPGSFHHEGSPGPVSKAYKVKLFPTFYVVDPQGKITWAGTGEQPDSVLRYELEQARSTLK
jgi:thiol-disulfide isomerase/thioredoxin